MSDKSKKEVVVIEFLPANKELFNCLFTVAKRNKRYNSHLKIVKYENNKLISTNKSTLAEFKLGTFESDIIGKFKDGCFYTPTFTDNSIYFIEVLEPHRLTRFPDVSKVINLKFPDTAIRLMHTYQESSFNSILTSISPKNWIFDFKLLKPFIKAAKNKNIEIQFDHSMVKLYTHNLTFYQMRYIDDTIDKLNSSNKKVKRKGNKNDQVQYRSCRG